MQEELNKIPPRFFCNQQILRLSNESGNAAQRGANRTMHNKAAEEGAELLKIVAMAVAQVLVIAVIMPFIDDLFARCNLMVDRVKPNRNRDKYSCNCQCIEESG